MREATDVLKKNDDICGSQQESLETQVRPAAGAEPQGWRLLWRSHVIPVAAAAVASSCAAH